ncbi:MAG: hypothetical protein RLZZ401_1395, partial [Pseudomonadota bacterium]
MVFRPTAFVFSLAIACSVGPHALGQALPAPAVSATPIMDKTALMVDQLGYGLKWDKLAYRVFRDGRPQGQTGGSAVLLDAVSRQSVLTVKLSPVGQDAQTLDWIQSIDFSAWQRPGSYVLQVDNQTTETFAIGDRVFAGATRTLLRSYYLQRCGVALHDARTGIQHAACHLEDGRLAHNDDVNAKNFRVDAAGGWHDAGDYGKYISTAAVSIARILNAFERAPTHFLDDDLGIPESHNGQPDLLDEMRVGLDWMLTMQRVDGAVYRKIGGTQWPHDQTPDQDNAQRFVYGVSTTDTAKASAAWALAARVYQNRQPRQAAVYLQAARRAWSWLETAEVNRFDYQEGDDSGSGPYRQNDTDAEPSLGYDWDDKLWAATELYLTTGEAQWLAVAQKLIPAAPLNIFEWKDPSSLALSYFLWHPALQDQFALVASVRARFLQRAKHILQDVALSGYRIANKRFIWGSNKMTLEEGILLCHAHEVNHDPKFLAAARDQLHYIFGRNHFGKSFVSGVGSNPVNSVNHLYATAARIKIPGLLVGGPNEQEQSNIAPKSLGPRSWIDDARSYATNEYAIDYNASLIGLIGALNNNCYVAR